MIVGDSVYSDDYKTRLHATNDPRVVFTGYVFGEGYWELASNAFLFALTSGVGGTHPALVEAMAFGNCVIVNGTPENRETIGEAGLSYDGGGGADALRLVLQQLLQQPDQVERFRVEAAERAARYYTWDAVADAYEGLFYDVLAGRRIASYETAISTSRG